MADEKEKNKEEEGKEEKVKEKGRSLDKGKIIFLGIIGGVVLVNGIVALLLIQLLKPPNPQKEKAKLKADSLKQVENFQTAIGTISESPIEVVVNIAGTDGMRFLKAALVFEYDNKRYKSLGQELLLRHAKLKNLLLEMLSTLTLEEVNDPQMPSRIRKQFLKIVNKTLPVKIGKINNVYINEFIVQ